MRIHDCGEVDLADLDSVLQDGQHFRGVCRVNDNGISRFIIDEQVSVVIVAPGPCQLSVLVASRCVYLDS